MANQVIRKDVIEISFKSDLKPLAQITNGLNALTKSVQSIGNGSGLNNLKKQAESTKNSLKGLSESIKTKADSNGIKALKKQASSVKDEIDDLEETITPYVDTTSLKKFNTEAKNSASVAQSFVEKLKSIGKTSFAGASKGLHSIISLLQGGSTTNFANGLKKIAGVSLSAVTKSLKSVSGLLTDIASKAAVQAYNAVTYSRRLR